MTVSWAKELLAGLMFVDPSKDSLEDPHAGSCCQLRTREAWAGLAKQKFAGSYTVACQGV
jgi:hypothetical protein